MVFGIERGSWGDRRSTEEVERPGSTKLSSRGKLILSPLSYPSHPPYVMSHWTRSPLNLSRPAKGGGGDQQSPIFECSQPRTFDWHFFHSLIGYFAPSSAPFIFPSPQRHVGEIEAPPADSLAEAANDLRPVGRDGEVSTSSKSEPILCSPGAGIFFFWQLGALDYLAEHYNLDQIPMVGASAGSLLSALTACGIRSPDIIRTAHRLALDHGVWDRSLGIVGIWGPIIVRGVEDVKILGAVVEKEDSIGELD